jgi:protoporphyrinogen IX oxidase
MIEPGFLGEAYAWIKAGHVIFVIFWMAGMFMLPRFLAYHVEDIAEAGMGSSVDARWCARERRLLRIIINPAMGISWIFGLLLAFNGGFWTSGWFLAKFCLVFLLSAFHTVLTGWTKAVWRGENNKSSRFFRLANEVPGVMIILIVLLVVLRPGG